jgi:peptidoglycan/LPS O-acetylase OafA/YrhL
MASIPSARTFPIALALGGTALMVTAITLYETSSHLNEFVTWIFTLIGLALVLLSIAVYDEERRRFYEDRHEDRHTVHM